MHEFGDGRGVIPPVEVQQVDVGCLQVFERVLNREAKGLGTIASKVGLNLVLLLQSVRRRKLSSNDHLITAFA